MGKTRMNASRIVSIKTNIIPTIIPSITSLVSISRMYRIPKNPVTMMVITGTIILIPGRLELKNRV